MNHSYLLALFCTCLYLVSADTCTVDLAVTRRSGAEWPGANGEYFTIYDMAATNAGTCVINNVGVNIFLPEGATISSHWNLIAESRYYLFDNFGSELAPQATATAGIIVSFPAGAAAPDYSAVSAEVYGSACPTSCDTQSDSDSASASASASSSDNIFCPADIRECDDGSAVGRDPSNNCEFFDCPSSSSDGQVCTMEVRECPDGSSVGRDPANNCEFPECPTASSSDDSASQSSGSSNCNIVATIARDDNLWTDDKGRQNAVYRLTISNQGSCPLKTYVTDFAFFPGEMTANWNLTPSRGGYKVEGYGESLAPGQSYSGAGIIVAGAPSNMVVVNPYGSVCEC